MKSNSLSNFFHSVMILSSSIVSPYCDNFFMLSSLTAFNHSSEEVLSLSLIMLFALLYAFLNSSLEDGNQNCVVLHALASNL